MLLRILGSLPGMLFVWLVVAFVTLQLASEFTDSFNSDRDIVIKKIEDHRLVLKHFKEVLTQSAVNCLKVSRELKGAPSDADRVNAAIYDLKSTIGQVRKVLDNDSILTEYQSYMHLKANNQQLSREKRVYKYFEQSFTKLSELEALLDATCTDLNSFANAVSYKAGVSQSIESSVQSYREFKNILPDQNGFYWKDWSSLNMIKDQIHLLERMAKNHNMFIQIRWQNIAQQLVMMDFLVADEPNNNASLDNLKSTIQKEKFKGSGFNYLCFQIANYKRH